MAYISNTTESGTIYTKAELEALSKACRERNMYLYMDGARLGAALTCEDNDLTIRDIAQLVDAFYIGGTKVGALCGEAVVFPRKALRHFMTTVKQHGALLAKGRLLGIQFDALFTDNLYFEISRHAIQMAEELKEVLRKKGCRFAWESPTNQQFVILEDEMLERLKKEVAVSFWEKADENHTTVRFATSWATESGDIRRLEELL